MEDGIYKFARITLFASEVISLKTFWCAVETSIYFKVFFNNVFIERNLVKAWHLILFGLKIQCLFTCSRVIQSWWLWLKLPFDWMIYELGKCWLLKWTSKQFSRVIWFGSYPYFQCSLLWKIRRLSKSKCTRI